VGSRRGPFTAFQREIAQQQLELNGAQIEFIEPVAVLEMLVTEQNTKQPRSEQEMVAVTGLRRGEVRGVLNALSAAALPIANPTRRNGQALRGARGASLAGRPRQPKAGLSPGLHWKTYLSE
jgi:hypothetical protein